METQPSTTPSHKRTSALIRTPTANRSQQATYTTIEFWDHTAFKISRTLLGVAASSYWLSGVLYVPFPVWRPIAVFAMAAAFVIVLVGLTDLRRRFLADPCRNCPLGRYPTCEWNLPRLLRGVGIPSCSVRFGRVASQSAMPANPRLGSDGDRLFPRMPRVFRRAYQVIRCRLEEPTISAELSSQ